MELFFSQYSSRGGRACNEDSVGVSENVTVVADGLGGQGDGDIASKVCVDYLLSLPGPEKIDNLQMHELIDKVNNAVYEAKISCAHQSNMATTVVASYVSDGMFNYFNVGDSRLYFFRDNRIAFRSKDHSVTQACVDMGTIKEEQMRFHEDRNKLTKALGLQKSIKIAQTFEPVMLKSGDAYLLCSDGFWEYVYEGEMEKALRKSHTPQQWLDRMLRKHQKRADGNNDNYSAVCVFVR